MKAEPSPDEGIVPLARVLRDQIALNGPLDIATFMQLALGHPEYGYYQRKDPFGEGGDFTTAPEISQMFGELVGVWLAQAWLDLGRPEPFLLVEGGPGRGTLMADILRGTRNIPGFHAAARIYLMETSNLLREIQERTLSDYAQDIQWIRTPQDIPDTCPLLFVANELLDAIPLHQLIRHQGQWFEQVVGMDEEGAMQKGLVPAPSHLQAFLDPALGEVGEGKIAEVSPQRLALWSLICTRVEKQKGAALIIDYGYDRPGTTGNTLHAVRCHDRADILDRPGLDDISALVDFGALVREAGKHDLVVGGPATQREFLHDLGIQVRAQALKKQADDTQQRDIDSALHRLCDPAEMGNLFKVVGVAKGADGLPALPAPHPAPKGG